MIRNYKIWFLAFGVSFYSSCKKDFPEPEDKNMFGAPNAFVLQTKYLSHNNNELDIEMDVGAIGSGQATDLLYIGDTAFKDLQIGSYRVEVQGITKQYLDSNKTFANLFLIDLSAGEGSWPYWDDFDYFNSRTRAMNMALREAYLYPDNELAIGSYARTGEGNPYSTYYWKSGSPFEQSYEDNAKIVFSLHNDEGGTSSIFDALDYMVDYVKDNSSHPNKNITVISHTSPDNKNQVYYNTIVQKAIAAGVTINIIHLGDFYKQEQMLVALRTGGFVNLVSSTREHTLIMGDLMDKGSPIIASIPRILRKDLHVYKLHLKIIRNGSSWQGGEAIYLPYEINEKLSDGSDYINNILPFYVKIP